MSDSKNRSAFRQERFGEVGLNQEFSTGKKDVVCLEQFVHDNHGHWRMRYAARVAAKIYEGGSLCYIAVMRKKKGEIWEEDIDKAIDVFKEILNKSKMDKIYTSDI